MLSKGGPLKELSVKRVEGVLYLVVVDYGEEIRIYYYSKEGVLLKTQNIERSSKLFKELENSTIREFHIGKQDV